MRFAIIIGIQMKNIERKMISEVSSTNRSVDIPKYVAQLGKLNFESQLLSKARVLALQNKLKENCGYQIAQNSLPYLNLYCEYLKKLKDSISSQPKDSSKQQSYLSQFSRSHSEDHMSKIFMGIDSLNKKLKRDSPQFSKLCLLNYFQLERFSQENLVPFLAKKVNQAKTNRSIDFQEARRNKSQKSFLNYEEKQNNKLKNPMFSDSRRTLGEKYNKIQFQILALKVILTNSHPDPIQTNKICQKLKGSLQLLFNRIKLKPIIVQSNLKRKPIFEQI